MPGSTVNVHGERSKSTFETVVHSSTRSPRGSSPRGSANGVPRPRPGVTGARPGSWGQPVNLGVTFAGWQRLKLNRSVLALVWLDLRELDGHPHAVGTEGEALHVHRQHPLAVAIGLGQRLDLLAVDVERHLDDPATGHTRPPPRWSSGSRSGPRSRALPGRTRRGSRRSAATGSWPAPSRRPAPASPAARRARRHDASSSADRCRTPGRDRRERRRRAACRRS